MASRPTIVFLCSVFYSRFLLIDNGSSYHNNRVNYQPIKWFLIDPVQRRLDGVVMQNALHCSNQLHPCNDAKLAYDRHGWRKCRMAGAFSADRWVLFSYNSLSKKQLNYDYSISFSDWIYCLCTTDCQRALFSVYRKPEPMPIMYIPACCVYRYGAGVYGKLVA